MIMLKDNHIDFAGGIALAVAKTKKLPQGKRTRFKIIVEARDLNEVKEIVACWVYRILLDNFDYEMTRKQCFYWDQSLTESSGNINEKQLELMRNVG
jgi:nicotinate-nucleotide pyrophosphorylase (carboxylating)